MSTGVSLDLNNRLVPGDGKLIQMAEHFDQFIMAHELANPSVWRDRLPKGVYELFNGTSQKTNIFRGTLGPQQGLSEWTSIEPSRKPSGNDPGSDYCSYNPQTYTWGIETVTFSGLRTSWRSPVFCVNDLKFVDQAKTQLGLIIKAGSRVTDDVKEVFNREQYVKAAVDAGKAIVFVDGGIDYIDNSAVRFSYDPFLKDANGDTYLTFASSLLPKISALNWSLLDSIRVYLADEAPDAAIGSDSGMPVYGLMIDLMDFEKMVYKDAELREDFRYARPQQLITGFNMGFKVYRGFALMHDPRQMRFKIKSDNGTNVTATRVVPRRATKAGTVGYIPETNPDYISAELAVGIIFMNDVIQVLVPPSVNNMGSGMVFGPAPGYNGEWTWINEYDREYNPLKEVGYFFARFEYFTKPLIYSNIATVFLYRRCPQVLSSGCLVEAGSDTDGTDVGVAVNAAEADVDTTNNTITLTLVSKLTGGLGDAITLTDDAGGSATGNIADASAAPTYTFVFSSLSGLTESTASAIAADLTAAGSSKVSVV
jgi:hypothetical protein